MSYDRIERLVFPDENLVAIVAALPSNSKVILAPGTHTIAAPVAITGKTNFSIEGMPGSTISHAGLNHTIIISGNCSDITLKGFRILKTGALLAACVRFDPTGAVIERVRLLNLTFNGVSQNYCVDSVGAGTKRDILIKDCQSIGCGTGVSMYGATSGLIVQGCSFRCAATAGAALFFSSALGTISDVVVDSNEVIGPFQFGVYFGSGIDGGIASNNLIKNTVNVGVYVTPGTNTNIVIEGNVVDTVSDAAGIGMSLQGVNIVCRANVIDAAGQDGIVAVDNCLVAGNHIRVPGRYGIYVVGSYNVIADNYIYDPVSYGIIIAGAAISHNTIYGGEIVLAGSDGIYVGVNGNQCSIRGVVIREPAGDGIEIVGNFCQVTGNKVYVAGVNGILCSGSNAQIVGNYIYDPVGEGIWVTGDYCQINGNEVYQAGANGIRIGSGAASADSSQVNDNLIDGSVVDGIYMDDADESVVDGNRCVNNGGYGVNEDATCDQCLYGVNHFRGNVTGAELYNGTNRTTAGNKT